MKHVQDFETLAEPNAATSKVNWAAIVAPIEFFAIVGSVGLLDYFHLIDFTTLPVHPYLFAVVLLAAQHGVVYGAIAALGAAVLQYLQYWPVRDIGQNYFDYALSSWSQPLGWLFLGLVVGITTTLRQRHRRRIEAELDTAVAAQNLIVRQYDVLASRTNRLERRLAGLEELEEQVNGLSAVQPSMAVNKRVLSLKGARKTGFKLPVIAVENNSRAGQD